jgi:hypothetical protein
MEVFMIKERFDQAKYKEKWERERPERERRERERREEYEREERERNLRIERENRQKLALEEAKKEIELKAMKTVLDYEKNQYRNPIDVSSQNLGYDIKSSSSSETRFIEVKGKADSNSIYITSHEWEVSKQFENNYYLYVVFNCSSNYPDLKIIQYPSNKLSSDYDSYSNKYSISEYEINRCSF